MSPNSRTRGIVACIATMSAVTVTLGIAWPFLAIVLERQGVSPWLNGLSASVQMMAVLVVAPLGPRLIGALGSVRAMTAGLAGMAAMLCLLPVFPNVWVWFPIRFMLGFSAELAFMVGDIWINQLANERTRGRLIGLYGMFLHGGFGIGPIAITLLGSDNWLVLYVGVAILLCGLLPMLWARGAAPAIAGNPRARLLRFLRLAPTLMVAGLMFGLIDSGTLSLLPVYGIDKGLDAESAAFLLTMFVAGSVIGQLPLGWLADHMDRHRLLAWCTFFTMLSIAALPFAIASERLTWVVMGVMGVALGSFYLLAITMVGARFRDADLVSANATVLFVWGIGMMLGPALSGSAMDALGPDGMPLVGATLCAVFLAFIIWRIRKKRHPS